MASWYRRFIPDYATIAEPLTRLTRKNQKLEWLIEQQSAFELLKAVHRADRCKPCWSRCCVAPESEAVERVLKFASRVLTPAERNYSVTERECLTVVWAIGKFRPYIWGYEFKGVTDHSSLRWLCQTKNPTSRLAGWALELQGHKFTVEHRKGALN